MASSRLKSGGTARASGVAGDPFGLEDDDALDDDDVWYATGGSEEHSQYGGHATAGLGAGDAADHGQSEDGGRGDDASVGQARATILRESALEALLGVRQSADGGPARAYDLFRQVRRRVGFRCLPSQGWRLGVACRWLGEMGDAALLLPCVVRSLLG